LVFPKTSAYNGLQEPGNRLKVIIFFFQKTMPCNDYMPIVID